MKQDINNLTMLYEQIKIISLRTDDRKERAKPIIDKEIQEYINDGAHAGLSLDGVSIESLPDNLTYVGGNLDISNSEIRTVPLGLEIRGNLFASKSRLTILPSDIQVGGDVYIDSTPLAKKYTAEQIKQMCPGIKGDVEV